MEQQNTQANPPEPKKKFFRGWRWILVVPIALAAITIFKVVLTFILEQLAHAMPI